MKSPYNVGLLVTQESWLGKSGKHACIALCSPATHEAAAASMTVSGRVNCVEGLLAALEACGVNNCRIELRGDEVRP